MALTLAVPKRLCSLRAAARVSGGRAAPGAPHAAQTQAELEINDVLVLLGRYRQRGVCICGIDH